jgi:hypothetical protein
MKLHLVRALAALLVALPALSAAHPAAAMELPQPAGALTLRWQEGEGHAVGGEKPVDVEHDSEVLTPTTWAIVGTLVGGLFLSVFYLLKRRVGGFPRNPSWVAPITIMQSKDFPDEGYYGDVPADAHGAHH